jgi:hypothetical protein
MYSPARLCWIQYTRPCTTMKNRSAILRAQRTPKGANPFSAPQLFAGAPRRPRQRQPVLSSQSRTVIAPVATTRVERGSGPTGVDTITVRRREYIGDVSGSTTFAVNSFSDNPGLPGTYPWLSDIAQNYEQYEVVSRAFCFETEAPTTATGAVILSYDYDTLDDAPVDKTAALLVKDSVRTAPWQSSRLILKTEDLRRRGKLYVRSGSVASSDLKTYDLGKLSVSTQGQAGTTVIGELWFEYVIKFHIAQQAAFPGVIIVGAGSVSDTAVYGTAPTYRGITPVTASGSVLTFNQPGYFLIVSSFVGTGLNTMVPTLVASTGSTVAAAHGIVDSTNTGALYRYQARMLSGGTLTLDASAATSVTAINTMIGEFFTSVAA